MSKSFNSSLPQFRQALSSRLFRLALVVLLAVFVVNARADERAIKTRVPPVYPELAKRMNVTGKVKIEVVITPDGHVKSTRVIGGHPLLVQACQDAVKEWKFMPATEETTQILEFEFKTN